MGSPARSTCWATAGPCWWCAISCSGQALHRPARGTAQGEPRRAGSAPARARGGRRAAPRAPSAGRLSGLRANGARPRAEPILSSSSAAGAAGDRPTTVPARPRRRRHRADDDVRPPAATGPELRAALRRRPLSCARARRHARDPRGGPESPTRRSTPTLRPSLPCSGITVMQHRSQSTATARFSGVSRTFSGGPRTNRPPGVRAARLRLVPTSASLKVYAFSDGPQALARAVHPLLRASS